MKKSTSTNLLSSSSHYKYYLLLTFIVFLVFGNTIGNNYNMDDNLVTQHHPLTSSKSLSTIVEIFKSPYYVDDMGYSYGYRPIVQLSFFVEHFVFGENAKLSHFFNLLLYVTTVLLLFKLLMGWLGKKGLLLAFLSIIFFAVHPSHSEVVASIKNRDEILALLFIVLAGLAILRYIAHDKWVYLLLIFGFSLLAILSKKSIYSMVFVLPVFTVLFKGVKVKQLILFSLALTFPVAIIASNLKVERAVFLLLVPLLSIFCFYFFRENMQKNLKHDNKEVSIILSFISWFWVVFTINQHNTFYIILLLGLFLFVLIKNNSSLIFQLLIQLTILSFFFDLRALSVASLFIGLNLYTHSIIDHKPNKNVLYLVLAISIFTVIRFEGLNVLPLILLSFLFFYLTFKKPLWALLFSVLIFIGSTFLNLGIWQFLLLIYSIINYFNTEKMNRLAKPISIIIVSILYFILLSLQSIQAGIKGQPSPEKQLIHSSVETPKEKKPSGISFFKENRPISYVENTLVAPHSISEEIGTGFIVLGTYLKLMLFPKELSFYYGYSKIETTALNNLIVWISILIHLALVILAIWQYNKRPFITLGIAWYGLSIALFSNWPEMVAGMVGERLAYTASAGFSIFIAAIIFWIKPNFSFSKPKGVELIVGVLLVVLAGRTYSRNREWKDAMTLMGNDIEHLENSAQANNLYAIYLMKESVGRNTSLQARENYQTKALKHFKKAVSIYPAFFNANYDIGRVYIERQDFQNAKLAFERAYEIEPESILVLEELAKTSFDLKEKFATEYYSNLYLQENAYNENIHEIVAYIMFVNKDMKKAREYSERGLKYFPANKNLQGILFESSQ